MNEIFYEHHCHTEYSNLRLTDSLNKLTETIDYAINIGLKGLTITDHECLSGHIKAIQYQKKLKEKGIDFKISLGNEIYLIKEEVYDVRPPKLYHFILIAKDKIGHDQLRELSSRAWSRSYSYKKQMRVPTFYRDLEEIVGKNKGHLIGMSACLGSYFANCVTNLIQRESLKNEEEIKYYKKEINTFLKNMYSIFGEDFYIELQASASDDQIAYNKRALSIAKKFDIKWVITNDVHYQSKEDKKIHSNFLNSKDGDRETDKFYEYTYFKTPKEIYNVLNYLDTDDIKIGIENSILVANKIETYDLYNSVQVPEIQLPSFEIQHIFKEYYNEYEFIKYFANSPYEQDKYFFYQIEKGIIDKKQAVNNITLSRINEELDVVKTISDTLNQRLSAYFNLIRDIEDVAWDDKQGNSIIGISRGSVTGFYTCYLMNIHQMNPIKWNLPYWRFLNKSRTDELPDIDLDFQPSRRPAIFEALKKRYGYENGLNVATFKTEKLKSAILSSCRGLEIDNAIASDIANSIPVVRGQVLSLKQCLEGDEEQGFEPNHYFINQLKKYDGLLETIQKIEGIVNGYSVHASGFFIFKEGFLKQNSLMKSPGGQFCTCWELHDSEYAGCLKFDALVTDAQDKIRKTMDLLIKDGYMKWQDNLWNTYYKYLHPDNLNYDNIEMWNQVCQGKIPSLFQFDTNVGGEAIRKVQPKNLVEMATSNSLCRITTNDEMQPMDKYVLFKNDINKWYQEMTNCGLNQEEQNILINLLSKNYGISAEQEDVMILVMNKNISNFTLKEANSLRKAISKKKKKDIETSKELFFKKGKENETRKQMLDYVWHYCIVPSLGYSFSGLHSTPYSCIALQEMNLFHFYPSIYWNCACLTIDAKASDNELSNEEIDEEEIIEEQENENIEEELEEEIEENEIFNNITEKPNKRKTSTKYDKIAKAIGKLQETGVSMELPNINKVEPEFSPDVENNAIIFGLKGISGINSDFVKLIIDNRPYVSLEDFYNRIEFKNAQMLSLIKAGCFDKIENISRQLIMKKYLSILANEKITYKNKLNMTDFNKMVKMDKLPLEMKKHQQMYYFKEWLFSQPKGTANDNFIIRIEEEQGFKFFKNRCINEFNIKSKKTPYLEIEEGFLIYQSSFKKMYDDYMSKYVVNWLELEETKKYYNNCLKEEYINDLWHKYCIGNDSKWEMESLNYYYHEHELLNINRYKYKIDSFNDIPKEPKLLGTGITKKGREYNEYQLYRIVGTVLNKDKNKPTISLLTTEGVITVKFYDGLFNFYDKTIKQENGISKKTGKMSYKTVENSWLVRGNKLIINGIRREDSFFPKKLYNDDYLNRHCLILIESVLDNGDLELKLDRERVE